ncbi:MAG: YbaB/EbfC family nucleoid-associated protein [Gemmatimonadaceae bacterium]
MARQSTSSISSFSTNQFPFYDMADFSKIFEQAQQMQARMQQIQAELEKQTVTAAAGGGMVTVEADGKGTVTRVKIDPSVADPKDVEMLEDLVLVAVNEAQKKAADLAKGEMGKLTGGLNLPFKLPF